jgi:multidrug efflux pump subunit AcrA (membrane-fusion protein)
MNLFRSLVLCPKPALALIIVLSATVSGCSESDTVEAGSADQPKPIATVAVQRDSVRRSVDVVGTLTAVDQVTVSSEADGTVREILADLGDRVKAGQVLIRLDNERQRYAYEQQQAALARTLAQYGATDPQNLPEPENTPDVQRARAELTQADSAFKRASQLLKRELIAQQLFDDAEAELQTKRAEHKVALQNARNLRASIQASEAATKLSNRDLRDTEIRAPFDGYVERRLVNLGELVKAQMSVIAIVRLDPLKVTAEIPERMAPWIDSGRPVDLTVDAYVGRTFTGKVTRISPAVNTSTRAFPFEAIVPNADGALKPGTFARVHVESAKVDEVLTLPFAALQYRYGVNRVFVVNGDKLEMRELQVGERLGERIEVTSGVKPGERVAVSDVETLNGGERVAVTK